jgi:hypothetical protein
MPTVQELNPGYEVTDGHAEREALGLPPTEATPLKADPLAKSSGVDGDAGDWTQTEGEGLTDNTTEKAAL